MELSWKKCNPVSWCRLLALDLDALELHDALGVYVIWHDGPFRRIIRVGEGPIRQCLCLQRSEPAVRMLSSLDLLVTWADVRSSELREGIEAFLAQSLDPLLGPRFPQRVQIPVCLPWCAEDQD